MVDTAHNRVACRLGLVPARADIARATRLLNRQLPVAWTANDTESHHFLMQGLGRSHWRLQAAALSRLPVVPPLPVGAGGAGMRDGETLAALRARIKAGGLDEGAAWPAVGLDAGADTQGEVLPGGLASGALHELQPATPADIGAATGFALGLASRLLAQRPGPLLWGLPSTRGWREGQLYPVGLAAFGIDRTGWFRSR